MPPTSGGTPNTLCSHISPLVVTTSNGINPDSSKHGQNQGTPACKLMSIWYCLYGDMYRIERRGGIYNKFTLTVMMAPLQSTSP